MAEGDKPEDGDNVGSNRDSQRRRRRVVGTPVSDEQQPVLTREGARGDGDGDLEPLEQPAPIEVGGKADKRSERVVASLFLLGGAAGLGFIVTFFLVDAGSLEAVTWSNRWLGLAMTVAFLAVGAGITHWTRTLMPSEEVTAEREPLPSSLEEKKAFTDYFIDGSKASGVTKRPLLRRSLLAGLVPLGVAPLVLLRGLGGELPYKEMHHTVWRRGMRLLVYGTGEPIKPEDFAEPGSLLTVVPEGYEHELTVLADATVQIIRFRPGELKEGTNLDATVDGIVAYSKICTHVGCATGLYEDTTHYILCPCHQSTFDASNGCKVIFGPASRALPQLPLGVDSEGYLIATGDFPEPVGPSFWGRG